MDSGLKAALEAAGSMRALARALGISHQAVIQWTRIPTERIIEVERVTGVDRKRLRPDLYVREPA